MTQTTPMMQSARLSSGRTTASATRGRESRVEGWCAFGDSTPPSGIQPDCLAALAPARAVDGEVDGLSGRLQGQPVLAGVTDEQRVDLVDAHPHELILGDRLE